MHAWMSNLWRKVFKDLVESVKESFEDLKKEKWSTDKENFSPSER
jgi:hypothetical protein